MTRAQLMIVVVWWALPALGLLLSVPRARTRSRRLAGVAVAGVVAIVLRVIIVQSQKTSSTGGIGFLTLAPLVWVAAIAPAYAITWRRS